MHGLVHFCQFATEHDVAVAAHGRADIGYALDHAMRCLVKHQSRGLRSEFRQRPAALGSARRQETAKQESAGVEPADRQQCRRRVRPGHRYDGIAGVARRGNDLCARVRDARSAGVADHSHRFALGQHTDDAPGGTALIVLVHGDQFPGNAVAVQQPDRDPRIFRRDHVHSLQHIQRAQRDIGQISDRCRDYI